MVSVKICIKKIATASNKRLLSEKLYWVLSQLNALLFSQKHNMMAENTFGGMLLHRR